MWYHKVNGLLQEVVVLEVAAVRPLTKKSLVFLILSGRLWMVGT